jgi:nicotinamidase-related amidase
VAGAHADLLRLAALIERAGAGFDAITVTLDAHHRYDIAHPTFWKKGAVAGDHEGDNAVAPFTEIRAAQLRAGDYLPRDPAALPRALAYVEALESAGRYRLMVWPVHCEIGSWGQNVHAAVRAACNRWEERRLAVVAKISKGSNPWTEHYSAIMAEVPDPDDAATQPNQGLLASLAVADRVYVGGQAGSHCVKATVEHLADHLEATLGQGACARLVLLTDCMSPVAGFEAQQRDFLAAMAARGARLATSGEIGAELAT